jgi:glycosyltransferase involved in cell wall biosynthesis
MKHIKILRTIESFYPCISGPANQAFRISKELELRGIKSPVFTTFYKADGCERKEIIDGVTVFRFHILFRFMKYFFTPSMKKALFKENNENTDVIHAHSCRSYQTEIAYKIAKKTGKPFVINAHGSLTGYEDYLKGLAKMPYVCYDFFVGRKIIKDADAVIVNSKKEYLDAVNYGVDKKKLYIIPAGIDISLYKPVKKDKKYLTVLFVGRISRNRNLEPIIEAAALLNNDRKIKGCGKIRVIIVGGEVKSSDTSRAGYLDELKELAERKKVSNIVSFVGEKKGKELIKYYKIADIFVYTSLSENFGQTILEAAAAKLPIICTDVGIAPEIVENEKNGYLIRGRAEEIAEKIIKLAEPKKREEFGKKSLETAKRFEWSRIIKRYLDIYRRLLKK